MMRMLMKLQKLMNLTTMNNNVLFISEKTLKQTTFIPDNLDAAYLTQPIVYAQDSLVQPILGGKLYHRLQDGITNNDLNENEASLLKDYIQPILCNQVLSDIVMEISFKVRNLGVVTTGDTNVYNVSMKDCQYLQQMYADRAAFYVNRLEEYLKCNYQLFKPYYPTCCPKDGMKTSDGVAYKNNLTL